MKKFSIDTKALVKMLVNLELVNHERLLLEATDPMDRINIGYRIDTCKKALAEID